jgi:hypothetical protein
VIGYIHDIGSNSKFTEVRFGAWLTSLVNDHRQSAQPWVQIPRWG